MTWLPLLAAAPWLVAVLVVLWRVRWMTHLSAYDGEPGADLPPLTVIVPARDEASNIGRCVRSLVASRYPALEITVVDDHSTDGTAAIARAAAGGDARVRIVQAPELEPGWMGKQWACAHGASLAGGRVLCFTDADTVHAPDLHTRSVRALLARQADLLSVAGTQELGTFWERVIQPQIFSLLFARYGGTEQVSAAKRPEEVIANGQYMLFRREAYDALGGHASVRGKVAEDLGLAMRARRLGQRVHIVLGREQLSTRMYESLGALLRGWMKNVYAGGLETLPEGRARGLIFPFILLAPPVLWLAPPVTLLSWQLGWAPDAVGLWGLAASAVLLVWWLLVYGLLARRPWYALLAPLGNVMIAYIFVRAIARGPRVEWKGRAYQSG